MISTNINHTWRLGLWLKIYYKMLGRPLADFTIKRRAAAKTIAVPIAAIMAAAHLIE